MKLWFLVLLPLVKAPLYGRSFWLTKTVSKDFANYREKAKFYLKLSTAKLLNLFTSLFLS